MVEKAARRESGRPDSRARGVFMLAFKGAEEPERHVGSQSAHSSEEAPVMGVEQRGAGRWIREGQTNGRATSDSASNG